MYSYFIYTLIISLKIILGRRQRGRGRGGNDREHLPHRARAGRPRRGAQRLARRPRITSYNVCYTKLLRLF